MSNMSLGEVLKAVKLRGPSFEYGQEPSDLLPRAGCRIKEGLILSFREIRLTGSQGVLEGFLYTSPPPSDLFPPLAC